MEFETELKDLKNQIDRLNDERRRAEGRMSQLINMRDELLQRMEEDQVKPEDLDRLIAETTQEITQLFKEARELIPGDFDGHQ